MIETVFNVLIYGFILAILLVLISISVRRSQAGQRHEAILQQGVELEAEILRRFEAGEIKGSEKAKARQAVWAPWDTNELELRYVLNGKEIVSRGQVSAETYIRTRALSTLKIKVSPDQPEQWAPLGQSQSPSPQDRSSSTA